MANKAYITAGIESDLHSQITKEAARNKQSFSAQIREYRDKSIVFEGKVEELKTIEQQKNHMARYIDTLEEKIRKLTDVN